MILGLGLRSVLLWHNPYAYWSEDSWSYSKFAWGLFEEGKFDFDRKRRWLYPIFLAFTWMLPGATLRWVSVLQHGCMLVAVIPFAYSIRKVFLGWKWWIVPGSLLISLHPHFLFYSDQTLAESPFVIASIFAFAGWISWVKQPSPDRRGFSRFLLFLVPFGCLLLLKPSGRMFWPGLLATLLLAGQWRLLRWPHLAALALLFGLTLTVGKSSQGTRLLYTSAFPMTRLDTDLHADFKAGIAPMVRAARSDLSAYYRDDTKVKDFLERPERDRPDLKLWVELDKKENQHQQDSVYRELSIEGLRRSPHLIPVMLVEKIISSQVKGIKRERFRGEFYAERMAMTYLYPELSAGRPKLLRKLYGVPDGPMPDLAWFQKRVSPHPDRGAGGFISDFSQSIDNSLKIVSRQKLAHGVTRDHLTLIGCLTVIGLVLSFFPTFHSTIGGLSWLSLGYLGGVYAVGSVNARFLLPVVPWMILLLFLPFEAIFRLVYRRKRSASPAPVTS